MTLTYNHMPTDQARAYQNGGADAYGNTPEHAVSDGSSIPCRHCLSEVSKSKSYLILAHRPFHDLHPYAETGPVFLCADPCDAPDVTALPAVLQSSPDYLLKGYTRDERIKYGTGAITLAAQIPARATELLGDPDIAFVDVRSARNNCWIARIKRSG